MAKKTGIEELTKDLANKKIWEQTFEFTFPCGKTGRYLIHEAAKDECRWCNSIALIFRIVFNLNREATFNGIDDCCSHYAICIGKKGDTRKKFRGFVFTKYIESTQQWHDEIMRIRAQNILDAQKETAKRQKDRISLQKKPRKRNEPNWQNLKKKKGGDS